MWPTHTGTSNVEFHGGVTPPRVNSRKISKQQQLSGLVNNTLFSVFPLEFGTQEALHWARAKLMKEPKRTTCSLSKKNLDKNNVLAM